MINIKKIACFTLAGILYATGSFAQSFQKGDRTLQVGVGIGGGFGIPVGLGYEHAVSDRIGIGAYAAFSTERESFGGYGNWRYTHILAAARGAYHIPVKSTKFDPYAGILLGYNIATVKWDGADEAPISASAGGFLWGAYVGSKYWFSDKIGAFAEVGYGLGVLNAGITFKLN
ncbi:hypothetical protein BC792_105119 [Sphingobacterium allocomposti]|uniref:Outer membrane protein with beta-barrel domain n=1 Tax=Sphingobacterium allocomposti TaxID=415956 RepID=A0A5S5DMK9_9SPHI|nr:hypothetical protein [Sphingobacterium composti Yoo et al. 2007 non Ten et al. 2007]TYP96628.1 hypothetical protein BC792_105119 [Sphingobacterium composti Yoo et al. 2007 non Ten et al. 2007]